MTITIRLKTDNAAFEDKDAEIARIMQRLARDLECISPGVRHAIHDLNGNTVGSVTVKGN